MFMGLNSIHAQVIPEAALILTSGSQERLVLFSAVLGVLKLAETKERFLGINDLSLEKKPSKTLFLMYSTSLETLKSQGEAIIKR